MARTKETWDKDNYDVPYIKDKNLYAAVKYANHLVVKYHTRNVAAQTAARKYDVDVEDVEHYMAVWAAARRKRKQANKPPIKYRWFVVMSVSQSDANGNLWEPDGGIDASLSVEKAKSRETLANRLGEIADRRGYRDFNGSAYARVFGYFTFGSDNGFDTKAKAEGELSTVAKRCRKVEREMGRVDETNFVELGLKPLTTYMGW